MREDRMSETKRRYGACTNSGIAPWLLKDGEEPEACDSVVELTAAEFAARRSAANAYREGEIAKLSTKGVGTALVDEDPSAGFQSEKT